MSIRKHFRMQKEDVDYINQILKENNLHYETDALKKIIDEHRQGKLFSDDAFINKVGDSLENRFSKTFTRIRLGANGADRNTQIMIELLNTMIFNSENKNTFIPTDQTEMFPVTQAKKTVKERIERFRTAQLEKEAMRKNRGG